MFNSGREPGQVEPFKSFKMNEYMALPFPNITPLLHPVLMPKGSMMVVGKRGIGKTQVTLSMGLSVASGQGTLADRWLPPRAKKVLYIDGEMPRHFIQPRLEGLAKGMGIEEPIENLIILAADELEYGLPDLSNPEAQRRMEENFEGVDLAIFDNISCLFRSGDENDAQSWQRNQDWLLYLRRHGLATTLVHHAGRNGNPRGTSKREDSLDTIVSLTLPKDLDDGENGARFHVQYTKNRGFFGEDAKGFEVTLKEAGDALVWEAVNLEDTLAEKVLVLAAEDYSQRDIARELGTNVTKVNRILRTILAETNGQSF